MGLRQFYETPEQAAVERAMIERACRVWNCTAQKMPRAYPVDWIATSNTDDTVVEAEASRALVECKARTRDWAFLEAHGGIMFGAMKWALTHQLVAATGLPFVFLVQLSDHSLWSYRARDASHDGIVVIGRTDRGDPEDIQPCILLRKARFRPVVEQ